MRKWLMNLVAGSPGRGKQSNGVLNAISNKMERQSEITCCDFQRKPRALNELKNWKATEYRSFLLYWGAAILRSTVSKALYKNFMRLHVAIFILCSESLYKQNFNLCHDLLVSFVKDCKRLFGREYIIYNMHNLIHLVDCCRNHGPLGSFSAFPFENYLGQLKARIMSGYLPLEQAVNYIRLPRGRIDQQSNSLHHLHYGPMANGFENCQQYLSVETESRLLCVNSKDCFFSTKNGNIYKILNILACNDASCVKRVSLYCMQLLDLSDFYTYPLRSSLLGIYQFSNNYSAACCVPMSEFSRKYLSIYRTHGDSLVLFPL
jgi:hypothetical protein